MTTGNSPPSTPGPLSFLQAAIKAVPAVKYALGVGGIVAVIAIIAGFKGVDFRIALFGVIALFVLMTVLVVFARISTESKNSFHGPAIVFVWFAVLLTMAIAVAMSTSVFIGKPIDLRRLLDVKKEPDPTILVNNLHPEPVRPTPPMADWCGNLDGVWEQRERGTGNRGMFTTTLVYNADKTEITALQSGRFSTMKYTKSAEVNQWKGDVTYSTGETHPSKFSAESNCTRLVFDNPNFYFTRR